MKTTPVAYGLVKVFSIFLHVIFRLLLWHDLRKLRPSRSQDKIILSSLEFIFLLSVYNEKYYLYVLRVITLWNLNAEVLHIVQACSINFKTPNKSCLRSSDYLGVIVRKIIFTSLLYINVISLNAWYLVFD